MDFEMYKDQDGEVYTLEDLILDDLTLDIYEEFRAEDELDIQAEYEEQIRQYNEYYAFVDNVMERYDRMIDRNKRDIPWNEYKYLLIVPLKSVIL